MSRRIMTATAEDIYYQSYKPRKDLVSGLIPAGLTVIGGAPKAGKSWMMLDLALALSKGEPFLGKPTRKTGVLYFSLEDTGARLQQRLFELTDDPPDNLLLSTECFRIGEDFTERIAEIIRRHPDVEVIIFDTFQRIRMADDGSGSGVYGKDYRELSILKRFADRNGLSILLVHHLRKMPDKSDPFNELSGSIAISGASDTNIVLKRPEGSTGAEMLIRGRDLPEKKLILDFVFPRWTVIEEKNAEDIAKDRIPDVLFRIRDHVLEHRVWDGNATALLDAIGDHSVPVNRVTQMIISHVNDFFLPAGIRYEFRKEAKARRIILTFDPAIRPGGRDREQENEPRDDGSDGSDG